MPSVNNDNSSGFATALTIEQREAIILAERYERSTTRETLQWAGSKLASSASHPQMFQALNGVMEDALVRQFVRKKPQLYIKSPSQDPNDIPDQLLDYMMTMRRGKITTGSLLLAELTLPEFSTLLGHEISHLLNLDTHLKRDIDTKLAQKRGTMFTWTPYAESPHEILADKFATFITQDPKSLKSALLKTISLMERKLESMGLKSSIEEAQRETDDLMYRFALIDETAQRMQTFAGRKEVETELRDAYLAEHKKLFPGQFSRKITNTRERQVDIGRD